MGIAKSERLHRKVEFSELIRKSKSVRDENFILFYSFDPNLTQNSTKIAISISKKKLKQATKRNKLKRLIQEAYRYYKPYLRHKSVALLFSLVNFEENLLYFKNIKNKVYSLLERANLAA